MFTLNYEYDPYGKPLIAAGQLAKLNPFRFSTKYLDVGSGLYYYGYRFYQPELGRWLIRDPIGERGGVNLYGFVANNPLDSFDPFGLDFIAVADRRVGGLVGIYHYSLQYWATACDPKLNVETTTKRILALDSKAKKQNSVELLRNKGWKVWSKAAVGKSNRAVWQITNVSISVIHLSDSSTNLAPIFKGTPKAVAAKWKAAMVNVNAYGYAEHGGSAFAGSFTNWPNSKYQMPGDNPFNNSNTFIRTIVRKSGMKMFELGKLHPGNDKPSQVTQVFGKGVPWKKGQTPSPAPIGNP